MSDFNIGQVPTLVPESKIKMEPGVGISFPVAPPKLELVPQVKKKPGRPPGSTKANQELPTTVESFPGMVTQNELLFDWPFPRSGQKLQVGDIVGRRDGEPLRVDKHTYLQVAVVSMNPFVLVSTEADMRWETTINPDDFIAKAIATRILMTRCFTRLHM